MAKFYTPAKLSDNIRLTPEGYLLCLSVPIARTGWQEYADGETPLEASDDGIVRIYRDAKDVFRPQTIASFQGKSVTIKHPEEFVEPKNWKDLTVGVATNIRRGEEKDEDGEESLLSDLLVTAEEAIKKVKAGLREVSCGYEAEYEQTGEGEGRQYNIVGNHIALVDEGRAGSTYAINDHKGKVIPMKALEKLMIQIKALGKTIDAAKPAPKKDAAKSKDSAKSKKTKDEDKKEKSEDADMYDELVKAVKDLGEKVEGMNKSKDEDKEESEDEDESEKEEKSEDEDKEESEDEGGSVEERLDALEAAISKLLESKDEDKEESEDEDSEEDMSGDEAADEEKEEKKEKAKDSKSENKKTGLEKTKDSKTFDEFDNKSEVMTADKLNELNAAHWARK